MHTSLTDLVAVGGGLAQAGQERTLLIGFLLAMAVFLFISFSGSRKQQKKYREMLASIKKGDRVMTIGGIVGNVVSVKDDEIVLKVDESTNTKIAFVRGAITKVLADDEKPTLDTTGR